MIRKNVSIYVISSLCTAGIPFLLLPILTRVLSSAEYGQIAMFTLFSSGLSTIIGLCVHGAIAREFFTDIKPEFFARFVGNCVLLMILSSVCIFFILVYSDTYLTNKIGIPLSWVYLGLLNCMCLFVINVRLVLWQVNNKALNFGCLQVASSLLNLLLSLLLLLVMKMGSEGRVFSIVISSVTISIIAFLLMWGDNKINFKYSLNDCVNALNFGVPLIPHVFGGFLMANLDRFLINEKLGMDQLGVYMVAVTLGGALNIFFNSLNQAYVPWLYSKLKLKDKFTEQFIVKRTYIYFATLLFASVILVCVSPFFLGYIVGDNFQAAADILPMIIFAQVFQGMYLVVTNYVFYSKKTKYLSLITLAVGCINIVLLMILIPLYGMFGAAYSLLISNFIRFVSTWVLSGRVYKMPWFFV